MANAMPKILTAAEICGGKPPFPCASDLSQIAESSQVNTVTLLESPGDILVPSTIEQRSSAPEMETARPVHIYPRAALTLLKLKCPTMRNYYSGEREVSMGDALISGLNRTLAPFVSAP